MIVSDPVSRNQKRIDDTSQMPPKSIDDNRPGEMIFQESIDLDQMTQIFRTLIQRHESFRSSFTIVNEEPVQTIHQDVEFEVQYLQTDESKVKKFVQKFIRPFHLSKAPLLRACIIKTPEQSYLLYDMPQIIADQVSMDIFRKELLALYQGQALPEQSVQPADGAVSPNGSSDSYWVQIFADEVPVLNLPTDFPRPAIRTNEGGGVTFGIDRELTAKITTLMKERYVPLYMVLLAAYKILLARYAGQEDVVVGVATSGRRHDDADHVMGKFANLLALRTYPRNSLTFAQYLTELKEKTWEAFENQDDPLDMLVDRLGLEGDMSRNPIFDVVFNMPDLAEDRNGDLPIQPSIFDNDTAQFDLTLSVREKADDLEFHMGYCRNLFRRTTIERMCDHYIQILKEVVNQPEKRLAAIDLLSGMERQQILVTFNDTAVDYPKEKTIDQVFEEQVENDPDRLAAVFEYDELTYEELNGRANSLARTLREKGVRADQMVGIMAYRSLEMIIGIMAILKAGGAYLPIDPEYPDERIQFMLEDSGAHLLLTQKRLIDRIAFSGEILNLEDEDNFDYDDSNLEPINDSANIAYMIYTSGSTGKPKGVMIEHGSVINRLNWMQRKYPISEEDAILQKTPFTFDVSVWEMFWWGFTGAHVCYLTPGGEKEPEMMVETIERERITTLHFVPSMLNAFLDYVETLPNLRQLASLRQVFASGEALKPHQVKRFNQSLYRENGTRLYNLYGPTEATVDVTYYDCPTSDEIGIVPIGKPIDNTRLYILNQDHQLQPIGIPGELCIAGDGLARGYLNRPELNQEKFTLNPLRPEERIYRTGDLARWLDDGNIEFLGRLDFQVKIRGFRIEIGEIENQLLTHPLITETVVLVKENAEGEKYLCAYLTAAEELTIAELREHLAEGLPEYMIPQYFVQLDQLPLTRSGKINRQVLPEPGGQIHTGEEYVVPTNPIENKLAEIWSEILGIERIGIHENFFELGGYSLKAMKLTNRISKEFEVKIPLHDIFELPTIREQAEHISQATQNSYCSIERIPEQEFYPVSSAQKRMYVVHQMDSNSTTYNMPGGIVIEEAVDLGQIQQIFETLIQRHESFRTSFVTREGEVQQKVHPVVDFKVEYLEALEEDVAKITRAFVKPFDLECAPLLRVLLVKLPHRHILFYDIHHSIADGVSMGILQNEFNQLYQGLTLPELRIQYKDFVVWQNRSFTAEEMKEQEAYWLNTFSNEVPVLHLPTDYPRPAIVTDEGDGVRFQIDKDLKDRITALMKDRDVTLNMVLIAAYKILLARYSGQEDIVVGMPIAGRRHAEIENVIGMFVNTLALRTQPRRTQNFTEYLDALKIKTIEAFENQDYQFEMLVDKLDLERDLGRNPVFDVIFTTVDMMEDTENRSHREPYLFEHNTAKFDLILSAMEKTDHIELYFGFRTKLFKRTTIERMSDHYLHIVKEVVEQPEQKLAQIDILTAQEREQILVDFNDTVVDYPQEKTIHQLFEEQVSKMPQKVAMVFQDQQLTYQELNARANQLARFLRAKGVTREEIVGIRMNRSPEMIIALVAILKAGGVYLPIDMDYPESRVHYILEDAQVRIILTSADLMDGVAWGPELIAIDDENVYQGDDSNVENINHPDDLIYIIYTSGSTGKPKGVMVTHKNVNRLISHSNMLVVDSTDRILLTCALVFDVSTFEIWGTLLNGITMYLVEKDHILSADRLAGILQEYRITKMWLTTPLFNQLAESHPTILGGLKEVFVGGEALSAKHINLVRAKCPNTVLTNGYGPTENTSFTTYFPIDQEYESNIPIGKPVTNTQVYIMDSDLNLQPIGVYGELCTAGDGVARGYLNRPDLTAEKFVDNPFKPGEKLYRTGDLARWNEDGIIEFNGRMDQQVKVRGFRIEPGEIENQLLKHPEIQEAVVLVREDQQGSKYLCAYIVPEQELQVLDLRAHLAGQLPDYMIPSHFVQMDQFPLTVNGKIHRDRLPDPNASVQTGQEYVAPRTALERELTTIWSEVLGIEKIGVHDNFFALGGHSIKAIQAVTLIHKRCDLETNLRTIFKYPTIAELARYIQGLQRSEYSDIQRQPDQEYYALSFTQKRLWVIHQLDPDRATYNLPGKIPMSGKMDVGLIRRVFRQLLERHESLRTSFKEIKGQPVQIIHEQVDFDVELIDLSPLPYAEQRSQSEEISQQEFTRPFHLEVAPLFRVKLIQFSEESFEILFSLHHIITDGWSMEILKKEFLLLYNAYQHGVDVELEPLRIRYRDFVAWQNELLADPERFTQAKAFWKEQLDGEVPVLNLPVDYSYATLQDQTSAAYRIVIDTEIQQRLQEIGQEKNASVFMTLLAGFQLFITQITGQTDILVGIPGAGREHENLRNLMGFFINTLILREKIHLDLTFDQLLQQIQQDTLQVLDYQNYPLEKVVDELKIDFPEISVFFNLFNAGDTRSEYLSDQSARHMDYVTGAKFDLALYLSEYANGIEMICAYYTGLFKPATIEHLMQQYVSLLHEIVQNPGKTLRDYTYGRTRRIQTVESQGYEPMDVPISAIRGGDGTDIISTLFERHVAEYPDKVVIHTSDGELTYDQLNRWSNKVAHQILACEQATQAMGLLFEQGAEMIVGLMGAVKTGITYIPIDPDYPRERIRYILQDAEVRILVTNDHNYQVAIQVCENLGHGCQIINLDQLNANAADTNPEIPIGDDQIAYILYTSGSTGTSKGVLQSHRNIVHFIRNYIKEFEITGDDRLTLFSAFTHDAAVMDIYTGLLSGATLYPVDIKKELNVMDLAQWLKAEQITVWHSVPTVYRYFIRSLQNKGQLPNLRLIILGGEQVVEDDVLRFQERFTDTLLVNLYGQSEASFNSAEFIRADAPFDKITLGRTIPGTELWVVDEMGVEVPTFGIGEIVVVSDYVAFGYFNDPEKTRKVFGVDKTRGKLYRTGDLGRKWLDGRIEFVGRKDFQVKIRGYRVELGEVESQLLRHPQVKEAAVVARRKGDGSMELAAYLVTTEDVSTVEIKSYLRTYLPEYMIPIYITVLDQMPLTATNKIDRKALPEPEENRITGVEYVAPENNLEKQLAKIWADLLQIDMARIGVRDSFFDLGGNSLSMMELTQRINEEFGTDRKLVEIFHYNTIERQVELLGGEEKTEDLLMFEL